MNPSPSSSRAVARLGDDARRHRCRDATTDAETEDEDEADVDVDVDVDARDSAAATRIGRVTLTLASSSFHHVSRGEDARVRPRLDA
jgi:hypothetical protein